MTAKPFRYLYHHACTAIAASRPHALAGLPPHYYEVTHVCCCSLWRINADGYLAVWRSGAWQAPTRGEVKSKACARREDAPLGAVEAVQRPTRARVTTGA